MVEVFNQGAFSSYKIEDSRYSGVLRESRSFSAGTRRAVKRTVFLSHKHDDLEDLKGFIGYLERNYKVECYIDADDPGMPEKTSEETAQRIKNAIRTTIVLSYWRLTMPLHRIGVTGNWDMEMR